MTPIFSEHSFRMIPENSLELVYENPDLVKPLREIGVDPKSQPVFLDSQGCLSLRTLDYHHRSVERRLPRTISPVSRGDVFSTMTLKGVGFIKPSTYENNREGRPIGALSDAEEVRVVPMEVETPWGYDALGLFDERLMEAALETMQKLVPLGFRTEEYAAVYRLKNLWIGGEQVSVGEWRRQIFSWFRSQEELELDPAKKADWRKRGHDFWTKFHPVVAERCMRTAFRIRDLKDASQREARMILEDAFGAMEAENKIMGDGIVGLKGSPEDPYSMGRFASQVVFWIGKNVGLMHREGLVHKFLNMGNITLMGEIVDLDSVTESDMERYRVGDPLPRTYAKDIRDTAVSIRGLLRALRDAGLPVPNEEHINRALIAGYSSGLDGCSNSDKALVLEREFRNATREAVVNGRMLPVVDLTLG